MKKLLVIDGNSILNRAFYAISGSKMLIASDGTYTNAVYGFLNILFKTLNEQNPDHIAVAFDLKAPTFRHKKFDGYKAKRKGMPDELAVQMPVIKEVLLAMNITILEKEGYEADDILGTLAVFGKQKNIFVEILTGDRDSFQLVNENTNIILPHTKMGKTESEVFNEEKIKEKYNLTPKQLIDLKGLMGDTSDNIPGVPGVGEKTALSLMQKFGSIDELYNKIEEDQEIKGKLRENLLGNKELAYLSRELGTIYTEVPINIDEEELKIREYNKEELLSIFKRLNFKTYIERLGLTGVDSISARTE